MNPIVLAAAVPPELGLPDGLVASFVHPVQICDVAPKAEVASSPRISWRRFIYKGFLSNLPSKKKLRLADLILKHEKGR
jgi:hypothetical protein